MTRLSNGRFAKKSQKEEESTPTLSNTLNVKVNTGRGFCQDILLIMSFFYKVWLILPYIILISVIWRYSRLQSKIGAMIEELTCGKACFCTCPIMKNNTFNVNGGAPELSLLIPKFSIISSILLEIPYI
jgi:hypothetical protein